MSDHGHVFPRADGVKARCGGPALCPECKQDLEAKNAQEQRSSKELVCAVCAEPWALGHRCKPTPTPGLPEVDPYADQFAKMILVLTGAQLEEDDDYLEVANLELQRLIAKKQSPAHEPPAESEPTPEMIQQGIWAWQRNVRASISEDVRSIYVAMRRMEARNTQPPPIAPEILEAIAFEHAGSSKFLNAVRSLRDVLRTAPTKGEG